MVAVRLEQNPISWTKIQGQSVSFNCRVVGTCDGDYIHWYQKVAGKPFTRILTIEIDNSRVTPDHSHPQVSDFTAVHEEDWCELQIKAVKDSHSATYHCACWDWDYYSPHSENCSTHPVQKRPGFNQNVTTYSLKTSLPQEITLCVIRGAVETTQPK